MKHLLLILSLVPTLAFAGESVVQPTPTPTPVQIDAIKFAQDVERAGNFSIAVAPGYAPKLGKGEWGLAVVAGYQLSEYLGAYIRGDLFDGNYYVASGSVTAQLPITFGKLTFRPFVEAGVGSTLGGDPDKNRDVFAIAGGGVAADLWTSKDKRQSLSALVAVETWQPTYAGVSIYRAGLRYGITF